MAQTRGILQVRGITLVGMEDAGGSRGSQGDAMETGQSVRTQTEKFKIRLAIMRL